MTLDFKRGYYIACANIVRLHGESVIAEEVLAQYGPVSFDGIDPMDVSELKSVAAEIRRKRKILQKMEDRR